MAILKMENSNTEVVSGSFYRELVNPAFISLPIIFVISAMSISLSYSIYQINIFEYIGLNELLVVFLRDAVLTIVALLLFTIATFTIVNVFTYKKWKIFINKIKSKKENASELHRLFRRLALIPLLIYSAAIFYFVNNFINHIDDRDYVLYTMPFVFIMSTGFGFNVAFLIFVSFTNNSFFSIRPVITCFVVVTTLAISVHSKISRNNEAMSKMYNGTLLYMKDRTLVISDSIKLVGKTQDYYFLYNRNKKAPIIVQAGLIDKVEYTIR